MFKRLKRLLCLHLKEKIKYSIRTELSGRYKRYYLITQYYCPSCQKKCETEEWLLNAKIKEE